MEAPEVDPGFRFIEDHDRRVFRENGRDLDPLDLAAGQGSVHLAVQVIAGTQSHLCEIVTARIPGQLLIRRYL